MNSVGAKLRELAERCEKATGPDLELDAEIAEAVGAKHGRETGWCNSENGDYYVIDECAASFTASLDAAMTLIDTRALWAHGHMEDGPFARLCRPMSNGGFVGGYCEASAATVPLATCAAALRALAEQKAGE